MTGIERMEHQLDLLQAVSEMVIAEKVCREKYHRFNEVDGKKERLITQINNDICDRLLTLLMVEMGYTMPKTLYSLWDYSELCGWLDEREEQGQLTDYD